MTGDTARTLPHLLDGVAATPAGMLAVRCLGEIGTDAAAAVPGIREIAESARVLAGGRSADVIATDRAYQGVAADALARITGAERPASEPGRPDQSVGQAPDRTSDNR